MKQAIELTIEKDDKEEETKPLARFWWSSGLCDTRDYEIRVVRCGERIIETTFTYYGDTVRRWLRYIDREHRKRRSPLVAGISLYRGLPDSHWRLKGPACSPNYTHNPIRTISLCLGGSHCLIYQKDRDDRNVNPLRDRLENHRLSVVGIGIKKMAEKLGKEWGVHVANPVEARSLAARAFGKEKVFEWKKKRRSLVMEGLELEELAELVLDGMKVEKKPASVVESNWGYNDISEDQLLYATSDAYLCFEIGRKCLQMTGRPT